ncbi:MAG: hypothetical protein CM15mP130_0100 [Verrucomicrobiota bacterium]|nr:MAG: hypothetical protein CM15mP130_0100 [Verrucomicrobiota bacterium]
MFVFPVDEGVTWKGKNPEGFRTPQSINWPAAGGRFTDGYPGKSSLPPTRYSFAREIPPGLKRQIFLFPANAGKFNPAPFHNKMDLDEKPCRNTKKKGKPALFCRKMGIWARKGMGAPKARASNQYGGGAKGGPGKKIFLPFKTQKISSGQPRR